MPLSMAVLCIDEMHDDVFLGQRLQNGILQSKDHFSC